MKSAKCKIIDKRRAFQNITENMTSKWVIVSLYRCCILFNFLEKLPKLELNLDFTSIQANENFFFSMSWKFSDIYIFYYINSRKFLLRIAITTMTICHSKYRWFWFHIYFQSVPRENLIFFPIFPGIHWS